MSSSPSRKVSNKFVRACAESRHAEVLIMLALGEDVDQYDTGIDEGNGWQAADGNVPNSFGQNGLQVATRNKDLKMLEILDQAGADFNYFEDGYRSPKGQGARPVDVLKDAVTAGFYDGVIYLQNVKKRFFPTDYDEQGALLIEAIRGARGDKSFEDQGDRLKLIQYMIEDKGFDANYVGPANQRPLTKAAESDVDHKILEFILECGVNPNYDARPAKKGLTAFRKLAQKDQRMNDIFNLIDKNETLLLSRIIYDSIKSPEDSELDDPEPLEKSIKNARKKLDCLLKYGADPYFENNDGYSAIDFFHDITMLRLGIAQTQSADEIHRLLEEAAQKLVKFSSPNGAAGPANE